MSRCSRSSSITCRALVSHAGGCVGLWAVVIACGARSSAGKDEPSSGATAESSNDAEAETGTNLGPGTSTEDDSMASTSVSEANSALLDALCAQVQGASCAVYEDLEECRALLASELDTAEVHGCMEAELQLLECRREHGVRCSRGGLRWNAGCEAEAFAADECF